MVEKIVLDAGHGGRNPGAAYQGRRESDDALRLAVAVGNILEENGYDVIYTRTTDATQSVGQKAAIANEEGADLFISIHRNASDYPGQYNGVQTLIYDDSGFKKEMAENINANLEALGFRNAGVDIRPNLVVLNSTRMPALLVEASSTATRIISCSTAVSKPWLRPSPTASWRLWRSRPWRQCPIRLRTAKTTYPWPASRRIRLPPPKSSTVFRPERIGNVRTPRTS